MKTFLNTIKLLRFPFSLFLLPVSLFSLFYIQPELNTQLILLLFIWHILVFPSSNGYNSYHDRDDGPIGGLSMPPQPTKTLLFVSNIMDVSAIALSIYINLYFTLFVTAYILISRLYSNRKIRLKKYPVIGFLVVFLFQGAWVFTANIIGLGDLNLFSNSSVRISIITSSLFIGTMYPITQIYQHEADRNDGVKTLSMLLGIKTTFLFTSLMYILVSFGMYFAFYIEGQTYNFWLFLFIMLPSAVYFLNWKQKSALNSDHINHKNTMKMLVISSALSNIYFLLILIN